MAELRAFVGHSFSKTDEAVIRTFLDHFNTLEKADIGFTWDHAEEAQALPLSKKVLEKIEGKAVFIGICTRKEYAIDSSKLRRIWQNLFARHSDYQWKTSDWIIQEIGLAVGRKMSIVLFLEDGVREPGGLYGDMEYIRFDRERPKECFDKFLQMLTALKPRAEGSAGVEVRPADADEKKETPDIIEMVPTPSWTTDEYEAAAMRSIFQRDNEALKKIDAAFKASDLAKGDARVTWEVKIEHFRFIVNKDGDFEKIKRLADDNPNLADAKYFLGASYEEFQDFAKAAANMEAAARLSADEESKVSYLGQAAFQYERTDQNEHAKELLAEIKKLASHNAKLMPFLVSALKRIADFKKDSECQLALLEYELGEAPSDIGKRFSLAYLHSQNDNRDMALYHYQRIPAGMRDAVTWNNLGVSYGTFGMPVKGVRAFRKSAESANTLAMSNLGNKLLNDGFFEEADELCKKALAIRDYHKNVPTLLNRLQGIDDDEDKKLAEVLDKVKARAAFYRELGKGAVAEAPPVIATKWIAPEGILTAEFANDQLKLVGTYEVPANRLYAIGGSSALSNEKYKIEFSGHLRGRMFSGAITRKRDGGVQGLLDGVPIKTLMYFSADGMTLNVMENVSSVAPALYELRVMASEDGRASG
jgi:tetratricopeptide (TPR) repeat protein